jgi:hypothetical protein
MIPEELIAHVHGPVVILLATRDAGYRPHMNLSPGARVSADRTQLTCYVPEVASRQLLADLADNGRMAVTAGNPLTHQAYQFKGRHLASSPMSREDEAVQDLWREKVLHAVKPMEAFGVGRLVRSIKLRPGIAITLRLEEIYDQTPGPRAGTVIFKNAPG